MYWVAVGSYSRFLELPSNSDLAFQIMICLEMIDVVDPPLKQVALTTPSIRQNSPH